HSQLLPYLEQTGIYGNIDWRYPPETPGMDGGVSTNFMPAYQNAGRQNAEICRTRVPTFLCPSDPVAGGRADWAGANNYVGNQGSMYMCDAPAGEPSTGDPRDSDRARDTYDFS